MNAFRGMLCPLCRRGEDLQPSQWGHASIPVCHKPSCIYTRTQKASRKRAYIVEVQPPKARTAPVQDVVPLQQQPAFKVLSQVLRCAGAGKSRELALLLADEAAHTRYECMMKVGYRSGIGLTGAIGRLRRRGLNIRTVLVEGVTAYKLTLKAAQ